PRSYPMMRRKASFPSMIRPSRFQMKIPMMLESTKRRIFASNPLASACTAVSACSRAAICDLRSSIDSTVWYAREANCPKVFMIRSSSESNLRRSPCVIAHRDRPYCPDSLAPDVKRDQQALFRRGRYRDEVWVTPLEVSEQQCTVLIEHVSTGTEIARRPAANMPFPVASNGRPIKPFPTVLLR